MAGLRLRSDISVASTTQSPGRARRQGCGRTSRPRSSDDTNACSEHEVEWKVREKQETSGSAGGQWDIGRSRAVDAAASASRSWPVRSKRAILVLTPSG